MEGAEIARGRLLSRDTHRHAAGEFLADKPRVAIWAAKA